MELTWNLDYSAYTFYSETDPESIYFFKWWVKVAFSDFLTSLCGSVTFIQVTKPVIAVFAYEQYPFILCYFYVGDRCTEIKSTWFLRMQDARSMILSSVLGIYHGRNFLYTNRVLFDNLVVLDFSSPEIPLE